MYSAGIQRASSRHIYKYFCTEFLLSALPGTTGMPAAQHLLIDHFRTNEGLAFISDPGDLSDRFFSFAQKKPALCAVVWDEHKY